MKGKVFIVGAGPGDPELLTLRALRVLETADVILHDDLVPAAILHRASRAARLFNVGKRCGRKSISQEDINRLLISYAKDGYTVARLQGGDPLLFGRAGEEMGALREAGVDFEVIPGVSSALAAAAAAGISLTRRGVSSSVVFTTGHRCAKKEQDQLAVPTGSTVVVFMPTDLGSVATELRASNWDEQTPCALVSNASLPSEEILLVALRDLPQTPCPPSPKLLIVGAVVKSSMSPQQSASGDAADSLYFSSVTA